jgi:two-component system CheB/CheR fusion protein
MNASEGETDPGDNFLIVGIGASAGGVEALDGFFGNLPERPGMAFVIVTHLNPRHESLLHEIVGRYTNLEVLVAVDGVEVRPDVVYVMPADCLIGIEKRRLTLQKPEGENRERKPIDIFFVALALDQRECAAGIVLSGGDGDGSLGIRAIKEHGGLTLAQGYDSFGPQHPSMPRSAIATGMVDLAVPVTEMGARLMALTRAPPAERAPDGASPDPRSIDEKTAREIYALLRKRTGHDFSGYKIKTFARRVQRRMHVVQLETVQAYIERLRSDPAEVTVLFRDLLINVTSFFRDPEAFDTLASRVVPELFKDRGADDTVRLWVPGCATGEEVFSLAILLREHMDTLPSVPRVQIFATDIDEHALGIARAARYPTALLAGVSPARLRHFFTPDGGSYTVNKDIRDLCVFSPHSVIRDPPFSRIDLVSCRNLLIYFGPDIQKEVLPTFHYALRPRGFLFLGTSENIGQFSDMFAPLDKKARIFRSNQDRSIGSRMPLSASVMRGLGQFGHADNNAPRGSLVSGIALRQSVEAQVLDRFAPAHVLVNRSAEVVYYSARTGKYLEPSAGQPSRQLLSMARKGLRLELHTLFREATETNSMARREHLLVECDEGRMQRVTLTIEPLRDRTDFEPLFVVLFEDEGPMLERGPALAVNGGGGYDDGLTARLERELRDTRERLQSLVEEYETAIEELKSSNEELVSVNEEVQSSNEELEASKEELQSLNEEMHTINAELSVKLDQLDQANCDLQNLFESSDLATIFLDTALVIRSFTPAVGAIFNILPGDRGRPITDITTRFALPDFVARLNRVIRTGETLEERLNQGPDQERHYLMRLSAYRDTHQNIQGAVVTFIDIATLARSERHQTVLIAELQHRTRNLLAMVQAIAQQTLGKRGPIDDYLDRLAALGRVQGLISRTSGKGFDLGDVVRLELRAHAEDEGRISIAGPPVRLRIAHVQTFALALHELATNAVKYGALGLSEGRLDVSWRIEPGEPTRTLVLVWTESGVEMPPGPVAKGYGRQLIERALTYALAATTRLDFTTDGVHCTITLPLDDPSG